jgi:hypothetical protein
MRGQPVRRASSYFRDTQMLRGSERWIVFGSGERCRASVWPAIGGGTASYSATEAQPRFVVFESGSERRCIRVDARTDLGALGDADLLGLYRRARSMNSWAGV